MKKPLLFLVLLVVAIIAVYAFRGLNSDSKISVAQVENRKSDYKLLAKIPIGVNSWVVNDVEVNRDVTSKEGIRNCKNPEHLIRVYFNVEQKATLRLGLNLKVSKGNSKIKVKVIDTSRELDLSNNVFEEVGIGEFHVEPGYNYLEIQGLEKEGESIVDINDLLIYGVEANTIAYIPSSNTYFGKRGPSVHMTYSLPLKKDVLYFYNEVTIPKGEDVLGSFFMVNGHAEGYFGLQVNSDKERRILFSIWSPFKTDDPNQVPEDFQVTRLGGGSGVTVQNFGNEGTGLQSFKNIGWEAGTKYKFLTKVEPSQNGSTDYTGWYFDPLVGKWQLVASLRRPQTSKYLRKPHSFLENFYPSTGYITRLCEFSNQWAYTTDDVWYKLTEGRFTVDATGKNHDRLDFDGGVINDKFYLKNCGFFNANSVPNTIFQRKDSDENLHPEVDFSRLEVK